MIKNFAISPEDMTIKSMEFKSIDEDEGREDVYDVRPFFDSLPDFKDKLVEALIYMGCAVFPNTEIEIRYSIGVYSISILGEGYLGYYFNIREDEGVIDSVEVRFQNKDTRLPGEMVFEVINCLDTESDMKSRLALKLQERFKNKRFTSVPIALELYGRLKYIYTIINMCNEFIYNGHIPKKEDSDEKERTTK